MIVDAKPLHGLVGCTALEGDFPRDLAVVLITALAIGRTRGQVAVEEAERLVVHGHTQAHCPLISLKNNKQKEKTLTERKWMVIAK